MRSIQTICKKRPDFQSVAVFAVFFIERGILVIGVGGKVRYLDGLTPEGRHECHDKDDDGEGIPF
ncbi:MAG: hypothetical protein H7839_13600 [Magnetococcus sp. YQC-5]